MDLTVRYNAHILQNERNTNYMKPSSNTINIQSTEMHTLAAGATGAATYNPHQHHQPSLPKQEVQTHVSYRQQHSKQSS